MAYRLELPLKPKIHPVFHVSLLKKCQGELGAASIPLSFLTSEKGPLIQLATILQVPHIFRKGQKVSQMLIQWQGLGPKDTTWEDLSHLQTQYPWLDLEDKILGYAEGMLHYLLWWSTIRRMVK